MDGMQMMMKALGVDPAAIMQAAGTFQAGLQKVMEDLATIKVQNEEILGYLRMMNMSTNAHLQLVANTGMGDG